MDTAAHTALCGHRRPVVQSVLAELRDATRRHLGRAHLPTIHAGGRWHLGRARSAAVGGRPRVSLAAVAVAGAWTEAGAPTRACARCVSVARHLLAVHVAARR